MATRVIDDTKLNNIAVAIQAKDNGGQMTVDEMPGRIANIPSGGGIEEKTVNFYNYTGELLHSYTADEIEELTEMPEAPTIEGLTFQGWNRMLTQLQAYVMDYGIGNVGTIYITDDGATRLYLEVNNNVSLDYELYVQIANGTLSVEVDGVELGSATGVTSKYVNYTIPFTLPNRGNVRVDMKFTGTGGFHIGQGDIRTRIFGWNSEQNNSLVKVELGEHVTSIGARAFYNCSLLNSIVIPDSVTSISTYVFYNCFSLNSIVIPDSVTSIGANAFQNCSSLNSIVIPDSVTSIGSNAFYNCSSLNSIVIPDSVTSIGANAFQNYSSLNSIVIPDSVTSIGSNAFYNCFSLNSIVIPDSVTSIGANAFQNCSSLNSIVIPDSVTSIGANAFYNCSLLLFFDLSLYIDPSNLPTFSNSNFLSSTPTDQIIYVANQEMLTALSNATNISVYANRMTIKEVTP